ncbi:hypothetical protein B1A87_017980 [Arthrobacter sp. KBS0703]|jgi:hypothetical protein|uniref:hypothetical protein n=1 Tax=Arthrobacter sp. KBS0703 TaxID=1955698 RepID=UPI0009901CCC|nr:hypothetical protein [Arthrobacter sp. KBS0703]TSE17398.1 hypothetical protein B1A87_017980 [Arthrobacter sp. KBS0703]
MKRLILIAPAVLLSLSLSGCTGGAQANPTANPTPVAAASESATATKVGAQSEEGQDLGNGRPSVSFDGLMVRRRVVIAVHSTLEANVEGIRKKLDSAAAARNTVLSNISPDVLEPAVLQQVVPEVIVALPATASVDDGRAIVTKATEEGTAKLGVNNFYVIPVLVHDLRFSVKAANPAALSAAVDREGILSDALGNYDTSVKGGELSISYTGPLLGDELVETVRGGIARQAHVASSTIAVGPKSTSGTGVDMATEPPWDPELLVSQDDHPHTDG